MSYFINPVPEERCVFLTHEGEMPLGELATALQEVEDLLTLNRWTGVMVDVTTLRSVPKAEEVFTLGKTVPRHLPRNTRVALGIRPDQTKHARRIEQAVRRGGTLLMYFTESERAQRWTRRLTPGRCDGMYSPTRRRATHWLNRSEAKSWKCV